MEQEFKTSFIPKKPLVEEKFERPKSVGFITFISTLVFIASLLAAGGVYFYTTTLTKQVADKKVQLELRKKKFDPEIVREMQILDQRLSASSELLGNHVAVSPIFTALQDLTLKSISFTKFSYTLDPIVKRVNVDMSGKATGYDAIALQSDTLVTNKYIKDPVFSNLNLDDKGRVTFDLNFYVDPTYVNFEDMLVRDQSEAVPDTSDMPTELPLNMETQ